VNIVVGVSDMKVSKDPESVLVTHSLGSCIGVAVYDPIVRAGGLLHFMLPDSTLDSVKAKRNPCMFADTGIPYLFKSVYQLGGNKRRMKVIVAGGAQINDGEGFFNIGKRNFMAVRKIFWKNNVITNYHFVGGNSNRTLKIFINDGHILIKDSCEGLIEI
jgi:chemotaxis protein CheD